MNRSNTDDPISSSAAATSDAVEHRVDVVAITRATASIVRASTTDGGRVPCEIGLGTVMPCAASSSAVPIIAVQSPACTRRSRPGQAPPRPGLGEFSPRMTATGARSP